jgi:hypothetical protein
MENSDKMDYFQRMLLEDKRIFDEINEIDEFQRGRGEFDCRYITKSFADSKAFYQIVGETPRKYILQYVLGEYPYPSWGVEVKLSKKEVQKMIGGRDYFEKIIQERKKAHA